MKTNANVAIHHLIGLALSIVRRPSKISVIRGTVSKLHINFSTFVAHLPLKVQGSFYTQFSHWPFKKNNFLMVGGQTLQRELSNNV